MAPSLLGEVTHYVADITQGARAARLAAVDAARRRHPAVGRLVPRVARRRTPTRNGRSSARARRTRSTMASSSPPAPGASHRPRALRPDRVRQDRGRRASCASASTQRCLGRLGGALRRAADPDRGARLSRAARRDRPADARTCRSARYQRLAHAAIDEIARGRPHSPLVVGGTGLYLRAALSSLELPPPPAPGERERWEDEYDRLGGEARTRAARGARPARRRACPCERPQARRARARADRGRVARSHRRTIGSGPTTRASRRLLVGARRAARDELDRGSSAYAARWSSTASSKRRGAPGRSHARRRHAKVLGLEEFATLPADDAVAAVTRRPSGSPATSASGCGGCPVPLPSTATGLPEEIADEIVALARAGERLPRR